MGEGRQRTEADGRGDEGGREGGEGRRRVYNCKKFRANRTVEKRNWRLPKKMWMVRREGGAIVDGWWEGRNRACNVVSWLMATPLGSALNTSRHLSEKELVAKKIIMRTSGMCAQWLSPSHQVLMVGNSSSARNTTANDRAH